MIDFNDLIGRRVGRLRVISLLPRRGKSERTYICLCRCGTTKEVPRSHLRSHGTRSCGCLHRDKSSARLTRMSTTHGLSGTPTYRSWTNMLSRCHNKNNKAYMHYGQRGIVVCKRWCSSFEMFLRDMGERPEGMSLDRIDNNGDYRPKNCRWASTKTQSRNTRTTLRLSFQGRTMCLADWAETLDVSYGTLRSRLLHGWSTEDALSKPIRPHKKYRNARKTHEPEAHREDG